MSRLAAHGSSLAVVRAIVTRPGPSMLAVTVACNVTNITNIGAADVRIAGALGVGVVPIRRVWIYGGGAEATGFNAVLYVPNTGGTIDVQVEVRAVGLTGAPQSFTIIGGGPAEDLRSQVCVTDLGPA